MHMNYLKSHISSHEQKNKKSSTSTVDHPEIKIDYYMAKKNLESMTTLWLFSNKYFLLSTRWFVIQALHDSFFMRLYRSGSSLFLTHHTLFSSCACIWAGNACCWGSAIVWCPLSDADVSYIFSVATNDLAVISKTRQNDLFSTI